jgi:hypothetical protein
MTFPSVSFAPPIAELLKSAPPCDLGPGTPNKAAHPLLAALTPESIVAPREPANREMALACLAGLWLLHNDLDKSHRISQEIENPTGSFWHGIMHRREGDFANAKYWFRRVGRHPVFPALADGAARLARASADPRAASSIDKKEWDPFAFVDLCERARTGPPPLREFCQIVQRREWELLFDYCYREAVGKSG